jgi:hypothetical protein
MVFAFENNGSELSGPSGNESREGGSGVESLGLGVIGLVKKARLCELSLGCTTAVPARNRQFFDFGSAMSPKRAIDMSFSTKGNLRATLGTESRLLCRMFALRSYTIFTP